MHRGPLWITFMVFPHVLPPRFTIPTTQRHPKTISILWLVSSHSVDEISQWIGLFGKILTGNHGFYHQIYCRVFLLKFSHHPILWISFLGLVVANPPGQISWIESQASLNHVLGAAEMSGSFNPPLAKSRFFLPVKLEKFLAGIIPCMLLS